VASTYSTNLALELIGSGDQSGIWGLTTNNNLGTLLEQSIAGYVTQAVTDSAVDTTLTIPNGLTGVARNMFIELTGALTATRTVSVPANKKLYFVYNNTTGAHTVIFNVAGQTGVTIPNGVKVLLACDGTDIVEAHNAVIGAFTAGSLTGPLTGNASTATALQTARTINGTSFNGTANITVTAAASTLTGTSLPAAVVTSSLTSVGTITSGTWSGSFGAVSGANLTSLTAANISAGTATGLNITGNAATATLATGATNTAITNDTTTAATMFPTWVTANSGSLPQKVTSTKLTFNPSTGVFSSTGFSSSTSTVTGLTASVAVFTDASKNLTSNAITGTGSVVMSTSPTITTPTLSIPTVTNPINTSQTLTDGATISWNTNSGQIATVTLAGNRTMAAPTNLRVGVYILHVIQDATGDRTLTWNAVFKWTAAIAPTLSTTATRRDVFSFVCDGTNLYGSFLPDVR